MREEFIFAKYQRQDFKVTLEDKEKAKIKQLIRAPYLAGEKSSKKDDEKSKRERERDSTTYLLRRKLNLYSCDYQKTENGLVERIFAFQHSASLHWHSDTIFGCFFLFLSFQFVLYMCVSVFNSSTEECFFYA